MTSNSGEDRKVEGERRRLRLINNSRAEIEEEKKSGIGISGKRGEYELMNFETKDFFFLFFFLSRVVPVWNSLRETIRGIWINILYILEFASEDL